MVRDRRRGSGVARARARASAARGVRVRPRRTLVAAAHAGSDGSARRGRSTRDRDRAARHAQRSSRSPSTPLSSSSASSREDPPSPSELVGLPLRYERKDGGPAGDTHAVVVRHVAAVSLWERLKNIVRRIAAALTRAYRSVLSGFCAVVQHPAVQCLGRLLRNVIMAALYTSLSAAVLLCRAALTVLLWLKRWLLRSIPQEHRRLFAGVRTADSSES
uniref:Uncharacterized protein n=1 Tax=Erythrolobus australicus TaxID=1077150 RepID=A0A7S1TMU4_9RHOD|mmetsp:Transcript_2775/g.7632  ORF Transcript_2775/g.7632 Transcript_2775/m.7632 type:complete len:218 (+) Transcript_2775:284-937(+)